MRSNHGQPTSAAAASVRIDELLRAMTVAEEEMDVYTNPVVPGFHPDLSLCRRRRRERGAGLFMWFDYRGID